MALVEIALPDITGWDVLQEIHQSPVLRETAVILIYPPKSSDEDYIRGMLGGADCSLASPINPRELIAFLSRLAPVEDKSED